MQYEILGKTLKTQAFEVNFDNNVSEVLFYNDIFIVLLSASNSNGGVNYDIKNNIYGITSTGEIIWQVQDPKEAYPNSSWDLYSIFFGIGQRPDGTFTAATFETVYTLEYKTGQLSNRIVNR